MTEALAVGFGYRTNAALLAADVMALGQYRPFSKPAFTRRLTEITGRNLGDIEFPALPREDRYVEDVFDEVEVIEFRKEQIRFTLLGIDKVVTTRIEPYGNGWFRFLRSHAIHTPTQAGPYYPAGLSTTMRPTPCTRPSTAFPTTTTRPSRRVTFPPTGGWSGLSRT